MNKVPKKKLCTSENFENVLAYYTRIYLNYNP